MASFSPDCRTYRDIPCRIRLSIASLLKISAFRKPRSLPTILAGSFSSSRLYFPRGCFKPNNRYEASAGNKPRRLQAPELVSSVHCSASSGIETDVSDNRRTFCSNVGTSAFSSASTPAQRASAASLLHSWRICDAIQQPFQRIKAGRHPQTSLPHGAADVFPRRRKPQPNR